MTKISFQAIILNHLLSLAAPKGYAVHIEQGIDGTFTDYCVTYRGVTIRRSSNHAAVERFLK